MKNMIHFFEEFRSTLPYKSGSIISGILSVITILVYNLIYSSLCKGEGALFVLPIMAIVFIITLFNTSLFIIFNISAFIWLFFKKDQKVDFNIFSDIGYFISLCTLSYYYYRIYS